MGGLFSGSKQPGKEYNVNNGLLTGSLTDPLGYTGQGGNAISNLLLGNDGSGFKNFEKNAGMGFDSVQGTEGIVGNAAAHGLLNSGSTAKALDKYTTGLNQSYMDKYLTHLNDFSKLGLGAGQVLAASGTQTNSKQGKPGLGDIGLNLASSFLPI